MDENITQKIKKDLCGIVKLYAEKGITNREGLDTVKTALSALSKLLTIEAMERVGGYSQDYEKDNSYNRDAKGRYTNSGYHEEGYSTKDKLCRMLEQAGPEEKEMIRAFMQKI